MDSLLIEQIDSGLTTGHDYIPHTPPVHTSISTHTQLALGIDFRMINLIPILCPKLIRMTWSA